MKTIGIVLLVLVLLLGGLPVAMGMDMDMTGDCPACAPDAPISRDVPGHPFVVRLGARPQL